MYPKPYSVYLRGTIGFRFGVRVWIQGLGSQSRGSGSKGLGSRAQGLGDYGEGCRAWGLGCVGLAIEG